MAYKWGSASFARMSGLDERLQRVLERYIEIAQIDTTILEGLRTARQCYINFGQGRTVAQCVDGGCPTIFAQPGKPKVTWLGHALSSNHYSADGKGKAVDLYPYPVTLVLGEKDESKYLPLFDQIAKDMFAAAEYCGVKIRWGANWNGNAKPREHGETDNPHFEVVD